MSLLDLSHAVAETNRTTQTVCGERRPLLDDDDVLRGIDRFLGRAEGLDPFEHGVFADDVAEAPRELVLRGCSSIRYKYLKILRICILSVVICNQQMTAHLHILRARLEYFILLWRVPMQCDAEYNGRRSGRESMLLRGDVSG
jgi:hypothetical protein